VIPSGGPDSRRRVHVFGRGFLGFSRRYGDMEMNLQVTVNDAGNAVLHQNFAEI